MKQPSAFRFIMISAMYENGGNTTHRLLDGHPALAVYPFESQPGTKFVNDALTSLYPVKYRWPVIPLDTKPEDAYEMIIDEEAKVRSKTPHVSKFRHADYQLEDKVRKAHFVEFLKGKTLSRALIIEAFFRASFSAWKNYNTSGKETHFVGYSPIIGVDGDKIIEDFKGDGYVLHVVRNPFSAYGDTSKRPVPLSIAHYMLGWVTCQYFATLLAEKYPKNFFIVRYEDIITDPQKTLSTVLKKMGVNETSDMLTYPSWNREQLKEVYPWGTIKIPTPEVNIKTAKELTKEQIAEIYMRTKHYIEHFGYQDIYKEIK